MNQCFHSRRFPGFRVCEDVFGAADADLAVESQSECEVQNHAYFARFQSAETNSPFERIRKEEFRLAGLPGNLTKADIQKGCFSYSTVSGGNPTVVQHDLAVSALNSCAAHQSNFPAHTP